MPMSQKYWRHAAYTLLMKESSIGRDKNISKYVAVCSGQHMVKKYLHVIERLMLMEYQRKPIGADVTGADSSIYFDDSQAISRKRRIYHLIVNICAISPWPSTLHLL